MNFPASETPLPPVHTVTIGDSATAIADPRPVYVLLHGWQKSLDALRPLGELLAERGRVVLVDLPGFGRFPLPAGASNDGGGWDTSQYAERVKQVLDEMNLGPCVLVGHSFGGRISVRLAHRYPELARAVVLIGSHGIPRTRTPRERIRSEWIKLLVKSAKKIDSLTGSKLFERHLSPRFGSADYKASGDLRKTLVKTVNENLSNEASTVTAPTLLLWGSDDRETPVDIARAFNRLIKGSELHEFPNKGHEPYSDVGSHLLATHIERFLSAKGVLT